MNYLNFFLSGLVVNQTLKTVSQKYTDKVVK